MQVEIKHKLSERNKLLSEYEVASFVIYPSRAFFGYILADLCHLIFLVTIAAAREEGQNPAAAAAEAR